jgi:hypothetical protein
MLNEVLLSIIWICHFLVVCFVVGIPLFGTYYLLFMHAILVPFMMMHWILNDNTCVLSLLELHIRKKMGQNTDKKDCFTCQLINPVYDFTNTFEEWSRAIYVITIILWLISVYKLYDGFKRGKINNLQNLLENKV